MATIPFDALEPEEAEPTQDTSELIAIVKDRKIKAAMQFLREALKNGPRLAAEVEQEAKAQGIAHATLVIARQRLYINSHRVAGRWQWTTAKQRQELGLKSKRQGKSQTSLTLTAERRENDAITVS